MSGKGWIAVRADCTLEKSFLEIAKAVRDDIKCFNALRKEKRDGRLFSLAITDDELTVSRATRVPDNRGHRGKSLVPDPNFEDDCLTICCEGAAIVARRQDEEKLVVVPRWNKATLTCDLVVDDQPLPLSHVSQELLEPFLFDFES